MMTLQAPGRTRKKTTLLDAFPDKIGELIVIDWLDGEYTHPEYREEMLGSIDSVFWLFINDPRYLI